MLFALLTLSKPGQNHKQGGQEEAGHGHDGRDEVLPGPCDSIVL